MPLLSLSFLIWFFRLVNEGFHFPSSTMEELWLALVRPVAIAISGAFLSFLYLKKFESSPRRTFWIWSFIAAAIFCIPYVPDMYASFKKAGEQRSVLLSIGFYCLGILTYGLIRGGSCIVFYRPVVSRIKSIAGRSLILYFIFLLSEYAFFHTWHPITYFPALPAPVPAARFEVSSDRKPIRYLLFETMMDADQRRQVESGGFLALSILGSRLSDQVFHQLRDQQFEKTVYVILPETFVSIPEINDVHLLLEPVSALMIEKFNVEKVVWIQGAFTRNNNVVLGAEVSRADLKAWRTSKMFPAVYVIRRKREQMPMFEAPSKGVSYSVIQNDGGLVEQEVSDQHAELKNFVSTHQILICYESLFPSNWRFGVPTLVLTNHHLFNQFHLMNWVYVGMLRQLSFVFRSATQVVSNYNPSGVLSPVVSFLEPRSTEASSFAVVPVR